MTRHTEDDAPFNGWTRRSFVSALAKTAAAVALTASSSSAAERGPSQHTHSRKRKRIALIATEVRKHSHAQHFIDRFLEGYGWEGQHYYPGIDLVSLYVDQFPETDLARERERRFGVKIYPTIAEALTLGRSQLAVDGVVIIGEHGKYPRNAKGQTLYPRYKFFKETVRVFEASGHSVPVFNDKHLSTDWKEAVEMVEDSRRLGFPFLAGSSLPITSRIPALELPLGVPLKESVSVCYGGVDSYDFHGLETAQCMSERRAGGEVGIKSVHALRGNKVWDRIREQESTQQLFFAAISRSHSCKPPPGYTFPIPDIDWFAQCCSEPVGYFIEHLDGFKTSMLLANNLVSDFTYAGRTRGGEIHSCQMHLPMPTLIATTADFFNPLVRHIEQMVVTGAAPYPVERTLLTTGMTLSAVESLYRQQEPVLTPEMKVSYRAPKIPMFWRS